MISVAQWLDSQPSGVADSLLRKGRAAMWRDGRLTLAQLLDFSGQPLSLAELRGRFEG